MSSYAEPHESTYERTLDLAEIAKINRGDRVKVEQIEDGTQQLFDQTISLLEVAPNKLQAVADDLPASRGDRKYVPENEDLRKVYLFAEALGGYEALNDLVSINSPGQSLSRRIGERAEHKALSTDDVRTIEEYHRQLKTALKNANRYLLANKLKGLTFEELGELYEILKLASARSKELTKILGVHLMHEIENAVKRLHEIREKARQVENTVSGIFMVNSEVMFIPTNELIDLVQVIFKGVGNPHVASNIDGVLLLAGRNLLIDVVSFYSFYGKQQIYGLFAKGSTSGKSQVIAMHIRHEIKRLFSACKEDNKLVLTRVMKDVEREFELSIKAIEEEAAESAFEQVKVFIPIDMPAPSRRKRNWLKRLFGWLGS